MKKRISELRFIEELRLHQKVKHNKHNVNIFPSKLSGTVHVLTFSHTEVTVVSVHNWKRLKQSLGRST